MQASLIAAGANDNARATWMPQSPMDVNHALWGLDFVSDDMRAILDAHEEEQKEHEF